MDKVCQAGDTALILHQKLHGLAPSILGGDDEGGKTLPVLLTLFIEVLGYHVRVFESCGVHEHCLTSGVLLVCHEKLCNIMVAGSQPLVLSRARQGFDCF